MAKNWILSLDEEREAFKRMNEEAEQSYLDWLKEPEDEPGRREEASNLAYEDDFEDFFSGCMDDCSPYADYFSYYGDGNTLIYIGDELEGFGRDGKPKQGIVLGRIVDHDGSPVCYKVLSQIGEEDENGEIQVVDEYIDYIAADCITLHDLCGDTTWSLDRIGYEYIEEENGFGYYLNKGTGDVVIC